MAVVKAEKKQEPVLMVMGAILLAVGIYGRYEGSLTGTTMNEIMGYVAMIFGPVAFVVGWRGLPSPPPKAFTADEKKKRDAISGLIISLILFLVGGSGWLEMPPIEYLNYSALLHGAEDDLFKYFAWMFTTEAGFSFTTCILGTGFGAILFIGSLSKLVLPASWFEPKPEPPKAVKPANRKELGPWTAARYGKAPVMMWVIFAASIFTWLSAVSYDSDFLLYLSVVIPAVGLISQAVEKKNRGYHCPHCQKTIAAMMPWKCQWCDHWHGYGGKKVKRSFLEGCTNRICKRDQDFIACPHCYKNIALKPAIVPPKSIDEQIKDLEAEEAAEREALMNTAADGLYIGRIFDGYVGEWQSPHLVIPDFPESSVRFRHCYIRGASGAGKSNAMKNMIIQDLEDPKKGVIVMGPEPDLFRGILPYIDRSRSDDLVYFDPSDERPPIIGFNPLNFQRRQDYDDIEQRKEMLYTSQEVATTLMSAMPQDIGTRMAEVIKNTARSLLLVPGATVNDIRKMIDPHDQALRNLVMSLPEAPHDLVQFWAEYDRDRYYQGAVAPVMNKFRELFAPPISTVLSYNSFTWEDIFKKPRIVFVNLSEVPRGGQRDMVAQLVTANIQAALKRTEREPEKNRIPYFLYIDEFPQFMAADESLEDIFLLARKQRGALHVASNSDRKVSPSLLNVAMDSTETKIIMRLQGQDAGTVARLTQFDARFFHGLDDGQAVVITSQYRDGIPVGFPLFPERTGQKVENYCAWLIKNSKQVWGVMPDASGRTGQSYTSDPDDFWQ